MTIVFVCERENCPATDAIRRLIAERDAALQQASDLEAAFSGANELVEDLRDRLGELRDSRDDDLLDEIGVAFEG